MSSFGQNIGIGTITPTAKLQINHKNTGSSPALTLFDSAAGTGSKLLFTKQSQGTNFSIVSTIDLLAAYSFLDFRTSFASGILLKADGKVGIGNTNPLAKLDVSGGVKIQDTLNVGSHLNVEGILKINGNAGTPNQVLVSNGTSSSPSWQDIAPVPTGFQNFVVFEAFLGVSTWQVPANITKIIFEGWSGGGTAGLNQYGTFENYRGGGSGAYFKTIVNVTAGQAFRIHVPSGQSPNNFNDKDSLSIQLSPIVGLNDKLVVLNADSTAGGRNIRATGILANTIFFEGDEGGISTLENGFYKNLVFSDGNYFYYHEAAGGDAPFGGKGGKGSYKREVEDINANSITKLDIVPGSIGKTPGGGGAVSRQTSGTVFVTEAGKGRLIIYF